MLVCSDPVCVLVGQVLFLSKEESETCPLLYRCYIDGMYGILDFPTLLHK